MERGLTICVNSSQSWITAILAGPGGNSSKRTATASGFRHMALDRSEAGPIAGDAGSVRMLERTGFEREGTRRERSPEDDAGDHDGALCSLPGRDVKP